MESRIARAEQNRLTASVPAAPRKADFWQPQVEQALRRARLALSLLELAGVKDLKKPLEGLRQAKGQASPAKIDAWAELTKKAWVRRFQEQPGAAAAALPWPIGPPASRPLRNSTPRLRNSSPTTPRIQGMAGGTDGKGIQVPW